MADQKLSQLSVGTPIADTDLFYSAQTVGPGYMQVQQPASAFKTYIGAGFQPLDGDLTAISALSGTNTIYYRSGVEVWSAVTVAASLSFSGGTLALPDVVTAGGPTGSASVVPVITYDAKGRLTAVTTANITISAGSVTGLAAVATSGSATDLTTGTLPSGRFGPLTGDVTTSGYAATLANIPNDVPMAGDILATEIAAPATPSAGKGRIYADSTNSILSYKSDGGAVSNTVVPDTGASNNFLTAISAAGVISKAQPSFSNISGTLGSGQFGPLTGDVTTSGYVATLANIPTATPAAGSILFTEIAAPSTPAAGKGSIYADSTNSILSYKSDGGTVSNTVVPTSAGANQFATAISAAGVITYTSLDADLISWQGVTRATGFDTWAATPSSANLITLMTDETGTGSLVFSNTPTLVTPVLGTPTSGNLVNCTGLTKITPANEAADTTCYITFFNDPTVADQQPKTNGSLSYNASTSALSVGGTIGSVPAAGAAVFSLNPQAASQQAIINFNQTSVAKWQLGKQTNDTIFLFDAASSTTVWSATSNGSTFDFTRQPTGPTPAAGDNTTKLATTAFVVAAMKFPLAATAGFGAI